MRPSGTIYIVDTDVLEHIRYRADSSTIYAGLVGNAKAGIAKTVKQVFGELTKHKEAYKILSPHEKAFVIAAELQLCVEVQARLEVLKKDAGHLWMQVGGKNPDPADPWLIAVAAAHKFTVVTDEKPESTKKYQLHASYQKSLADVFLSLIF